MVITGMLTITVMNGTLMSRKAGESERKKVSDISPYWL